MVRYARLYLPRRFCRSRRWYIDPVSRRRQRYDDDDYYTPRCPRCRYFLIARVNASGPYYHCLCKK